MKLILLDNDGVEIESWDLAEYDLSQALPRLDLIEDIAQKVTENEILPSI